MHTEEKPKSPDPSPTSVSTESIHDAEKKSKKILIIILIIAAVIVLFGAVGVGSYWMVYQHPQDSAVKQRLKDTIPFPVAMVNGKRLPLKDFEEKVNSAMYFLNKQQELNLGVVDTVPTVEEVRTQTLDKMINIAILEEIAAEHNVTVSDEELEKVITDEIIPQANSREEMEKTLQELYQWNVDDFKKHVIYESVLERKVTEALAADDSNTKAAEERAKQVYEEVNNGSKSFEDAAKEYSSDTTAEDGGKLGSFGKGVMVKEFEDAAFALKKGEISQPVKTQFGYHIIKVTGRDDKAGTVEASHILIAFDSIEKRVEDRKNAAKITRLMPKY